MDDPIQAFQSTVLDDIARGESPRDLFDQLARLGERMLPGAVVGVTMLDRSAHLFEEACFPSLDPAYAKALEGIAVVDRPGSCALAVYDNQTVVCDDVASDPRFSEAWKALCLSHGLNALTSVPASVDGEYVLGTLVVAYAPGTRFTAAEQATIDRLARLAGQLLAYRRNQARQQLLIGELQHRVRNLFGTIGAVVYSTLKSYPDPARFRPVFDGRLVALAKAHSLALESDETDLRQIFADTLAPYSIDHRVEIEGPSVRLSREASVAFCLAAHELATNAAKYGAFKRPDGRIAIGWRIAEDDEGRGRFDLSWREQGGPPVSEPSRAGYGQQTLKRSLASAFDGKVELDFAPDGLRVSVSAPYSPRLGQRMN